jgi:hypothetical protein
MKIRSMVVGGLVGLVTACGGKDTSGTADAPVADANPSAPDADPSAPDANPNAPDARLPDAQTGACSKVLTTSMYIDDTDTAGDLAALDGVKSVKSLTVSAKNLTSLAGLECLETVTDTFYITQATKLDNIDALAGMRQIGGLIMMGNSVLKSVKPLEGLTQLGGAQLFNNPMMCGAGRLKTDMVAKGTNAQYFTYGGNGADDCP